MNLYDIHPDPENAPGYATRYDTVPELVWERYKDFPDELKKRESVLARDADWAYQYAYYILHGPFPAGEPAIAKNITCAYWYARYILKGPFPAGETAIAMHPHYALSYASSVLELPDHKARNWGQQ